METVERTLFLNGTIAEESWFDDDVTPQMFKEELLDGSGNITVWINSPDGDCVAAAQIYNMLREYEGKVTVKIDGIAASVASVIAMAGDKVLMSPVSMMMIHNPMTVAFGDSGEMQKAIEMLSSVKDGTFIEGKEQIVQSRLPISYDPNASVPKCWLAFLEGLLYEEDIPTLQEFIGYCLIPSNKGQRMMVIKGNGGEGKSQIGAVLGSIFGTNMKDGSIGKISENRFARADLEHVLLCVDDDMRMEALRQTNYVKSLVTAQGKMDLEQKGKQSYQGWMYARLLAFSNGDLQALYDRSDGFYRRQLVLTTKEKPAGRVDDPDLAEKMKLETEGIFLWAFEGLQRLVSNHFKFTESDRIKGNREAVKRDNNNLFDFMDSEGYIRFREDAAVSSKELYTTYQMWCEENSMIPLKARSFSDAVVKNAEKYNIKHCNTVINSAGRRVWGFQGIESLLRPDHTGFYPVSQCTYVPEEWRE